MACGTEGAQIRYLWAEVAQDGGGGKTGGCEGGKGHEPLRPVAGSVSLGTLGEVYAGELLLWGVGGGLTGWEPGKGLGGGGVRISARAFCGAGLMGASDVVEEVYVYEPPRKLVRCRVACQEEASPHTDACNDSTVVTERVSTFHFRATTCACMSAYALRVHPGTTASAHITHMHSHECTRHDRDRFKQRLSASGEASRRPRSVARVSMRARACLCVCVRARALHVRVERER